MVFITTGSELALGTYGLVNSAVAFVGYYVASRFIKQKIAFDLFSPGPPSLWSSLFAYL